MAFSALMIDLLNGAVLHLVKTKLVLVRTLLNLKKWHFESPRVEYGGKYVECQEIIMQVLFSSGT